MELPIYTADFNNVSIIGFEISYDTNMITFEGIIDAPLSGFSNGHYNDVGGRIIVGWDHPQGETQSVDNLLMKLKFKVANGVFGKTHLTFDNMQVLDGDFGSINTDTQDGSIDISLTNSIELSEGYDIKVYPNPFMDHLNIEVNLPGTQPLEIQLHSLDGKLIRSASISDNKVHHFIQIKDIQYQGVLICTIKSGAYNMVYRVVKI